MFRICALFSPRISSPPLSPYYLHAFPISRNCLAPPHFPAYSRAFIPQYIYSPHKSLVPCEFVFLISLFDILLPPRVFIFLFPVSDSCLACLSCFQCPCLCPVSLVFVFSTCLCLLVFSVLILWLLLPVLVLPCVLLVFGLLVMLNVDLTSWFWHCFRVLADDSLVHCFCTAIYLITWILTSAC